MNKDIVLNIGMVHDAVLQWAYGANKTMEEGHDLADGVKVTQNILNSTFQGIMGKVKVDEFGDRQPDARYMKLFLKY